MKEIEKPITMMIDEFREKIEDALNNSGLPAWLMLYVLDPYMRQLQQIDGASRAKEKADYEEAVKSNVKEDESGS